MHHLKKKRFASLKEQGTTAEELKKLILEDGNTEEEANALLAELFTGTSPNPLPTVTAAAGGDHSAPNVNPPGETEGEAPAQSKGHPKFDYKNLTGENFKKYEAYVHGLPWHDMHDFLVYKVNPVITERYSGLKDTPKDMTGIDIINDRPIHQTRVDVKTALEMNAQVRNSGRYYLLK
jgi:hypothetical protein